jgi:hypothetical protein
VSQAAKYSFSGAAQALAGRSGLRGGRCGGLLHSSLRCGVGQFVRTGGLHMVGQHTGAHLRHRSASCPGDCEDDEFAIKLPRPGGIVLAVRGLGQQARLQQGFGHRCAWGQWQVSRRSGQAGRVRSGSEEDGALGVGEAHVRGSRCSTRPSGATTQSPAEESVRAARRRQPLRTGDHSLCGRRK